MNTGKEDASLPRDSRPDPFFQPERPHFLAAEDPQDPMGCNNDLGKGSFQILKVKAAFEFAYQQLGAPSDRHEPILQRIIR